MSNEYAEFFEEFMEESRDHLNTMNLSLLEIEKEKSNPNKEQIDNLFRAAHTVKGLAGMMEFGPVEALCHAVEDLMDLVRNDKFQLNDSAFQVLFTSLDILENLLNELAESKTTETPVDAVIAAVKECISGGGATNETDSSETATPTPKGQCVDVDFSYDFDEFVISEIEKLKIEGSVKANRFIFEVAANLEGGTPLEDLEELPFIENLTDIGTILLFSPPLREIEAASGTIKTIILVATELNEQQFAEEISEPFELIRKGQIVKAHEEERVIEEAPEAVVEETVAEETVVVEQKITDDSFVETDYSDVAFCDDVSLVDTEMLEEFNADIEELIESLDLALIDLENNPEDLDTISTVFRAAHTIKGTSAMFGFSRVVELTHRLENLFDDIRKEKIKIDASLMDIVFSSVDKLRVCLNEIKDFEDDGADITAEVNRLAQFMEGLAKGEQIPVSSSSVGAEKSATSNLSEFTVEGFQITDSNKALIENGFAKGEKLYVLGISFQDDVMKSSFDPMNIFMLLEMVGDLVATAMDISHVPDIAELDPEKFYLKYKYLLVSDQSEDEIKATFSSMDQVIVDSLTEVSPDTAQNTQQEAPVTTAAPQKTPAQEIPKAEVSIVAPAPASVPTPVKEPTAPAQKMVQKSESKQEKVAGKMAGKTSATIRVDIERLDKLLNLVGEFVIDRTRYTQIGEDLKREHQNSPYSKMLSETNMLFGRHMNEIQEVIMSVRMVPIGNAFNKFPRVVRDLARNLGKDIDLTLFGEETELDKTLVEEIGDPLVHLVRNSVDHGIEMPDVREANGKPRKGTIKMSAFQEGNNIVIEIEDDGGGINKERILAKAVERGLVGENDQLTDKEIFNLIFEAGFSTAEVVSNVSGRGVGMDVVKRNIEKLKGIIDIESKMGEGSTITIKLPLTLAIVQTLIVSCGTESLAIPLSSVIETVRIEPDEVKILQGKEMINLRNNVLPLLNLADFYSFNKAVNKEDETKKRRGRKKKKEQLFVVIVGLAEKRLGLVVNSLKTQQEIVIKSIGKLLNNALGISGGTIMGDGNVVLIVDVAEVIHNADKVKINITQKTKKEEQQGKTILLYNKSQKVLNSMKDFLEDFDLVISRSEEDFSKKLSYYDIDLIITEHQENHDINWKDIMKENAKKNAPVIFLTEENASVKKRRNTKNEVFLSEAVNKTALLGQINKLM